MESRELELEGTGPRVGGHSGGQTGMFGSQNDDTVCVCVGGQVLEEKGRQERGSDMGVMGRKTGVDLGPRADLETCLWLQLHTVKGSSGRGVVYKVPGPGRDGRT